MSRILARTRQRALVASASFVGLLLLAGCDCVGPSQPPIDLTVTATDAASSIDVNRPATVTVTVANPTAQDLDRVDMTIGGSGSGSAEVSFITCTAQGVTCPTPITGATIPEFRLPAGSRLQFVVNAKQSLPADGVEPIYATV